MPAEALAREPTAAAELAARTPPRQISSVAPRRTNAMWMRSVRVPRSAVTVALAAPSLIEKVQE
jgi:hypothetical protein